MLDMFKQKTQKEIDAADVGDAIIYWAFGILIVVVVAYALTFV